jgi:hypothetical protein
MFIVAGIIKALDVVAPLEQFGKRRERAISILHATLSTASRSATAPAWQVPGPQEQGNRMSKVTFSVLRLSYYSNKCIYKKNRATVLVARDKRRSNADKLTKSKNEPQLL